jgi:beta-lactamase regulating signal transducer with metallopeptidase domain
MTTAMWIQPAIQAAAGGLLNSLWQGALIAAIVVALRQVLHESRPQKRYVLYCVGLATLTVWPLVTFIRLRMSSSAADITAGALTLPWNLGALHQYWTALSPAVVALWCVGVIAQSLRWAGASVYIHQMKRELSTVAVPDELADALKRVCMRLGVAGSRIRLVVSSRVAVPSVAGCLKPVILMPFAALSGVPGEYVEALLAHELAHVLRHDYLVNLLQRVAEAVLFYHPAAWWLSRQIRIEREQCCDDVAAAACDDRLVYARALLAVEERRAAAPQLALAATDGDLKRRITRLLFSEVPQRNTASWLAVPALAGAVSIAMLFGMPSAVSMIHQQTSIEKLASVDISSAGQLNPALIRPVARTDAPPLPHISKLQINRMQRRAVVRHVAAKKTAQTPTQRSIQVVVVAYRFSVPMASEYSTDFETQSSPLLGTAAPAATTYMMIRVPDGILLVPIPAPLVSPVVNFEVR